MSGNWVQGIHHVTGAATSAQGDYDFYTKVLGLHLVKRTINHETADQWHLFYGDAAGNPGTIMTNFIFEDTPLPAYQRGRGTITEVSYSVPRGSLPFWRERLRAAGVWVDRREAKTRFGDAVLSFRDSSGIPGELVECDDARDPGPPSLEEISTSKAIRGFHGVTLLSRLPELTLDFFANLLRFEVVGVEGNRTRLRVQGDGHGVGGFVDVLDEPAAAWGRWGLGGIHHVAFTVRSLAQMEQLWRVLSGAGFILTDLRDRKWFHSMYLTEPGGINVELSNLEPGWTVDESAAELGKVLCLPKQWEDQRAQIEAKLTPLRF
jgi:glyoxalase family protein